MSNMSEKFSNFRIHFIRTCNPSICSSVNLLFIKNPNPNHYSFEQTVSYSSA